MGISRANVGRWYHGLDPGAENIAQITQALKPLVQLVNEDSARIYPGKITRPVNGKEEKTSK